MVLSPAGLALGGVRGERERCPLPSGPRCALVEPWRASPSMNPGILGAVSSHGGPPASRACLLDAAGEQRVL